MLGGESERSGCRAELLPNGKGGFIFNIVRLERGRKKACLSMVDKLTTVQWHRQSKRPLTSLPKLGSKLRGFKLRFIGTLSKWRNDLQPHNLTKELHLEIPFDYSVPLKARSTAPYQILKRRLHSHILEIYPPYGVIVISYAVFWKWCKWGAVCGLFDEITTNICYIIAILRDKRVILRKTYILFKFYTWMAYIRKITQSKWQFLLWMWQICISVH